MLRFFNHVELEPGSAVYDVDLCSFIVITRTRRVGSKLRLSWIRTLPNGAVVEDQALCSRSRTALFSRGWRI